MGDTGNERQRDFDRFLTFIDAIVAIAITLLVLPLVDLASRLGGGSVSHLLDENQSQIWTFLLSFLVISNLWLIQHRVLHHVVAADPWILRLLLLWTLTIVALPFPTALLAQGNAGHQATTKLLYVGTMTASSLVLALLCVAIGRNDAIRDSPERPEQLRAFTVVGVFLLVLALMLLFSSLSFWPLLLLVLPDWLVARWREFERRHAGGA
jgi:uncharacterized membrane protein